MRRSQFRDITQTTGTSLCVIWTSLRAYFAWRTKIVVAWESSYFIYWAVRTSLTWKTLSSPEWRLICSSEARFIGFSIIWNVTSEGWSIVSQECIWRAENIRGISVRSWTIWSLLADIAVLTTALNTDHKLSIRIDHLIGPTEFSRITINAIRTIVSGLLTIFTLFRHGRPFWAISS